MSERLRAVADQAAMAIRSTCVIEIVSPRCWSIPAALADVVLTAYPTRRWQSVWMSIIVHSAQSVFIFFIILVLVLG